MLSVLINWLGHLVLGFQRAVCTISRVLGPRWLGQCVEMTFPGLFRSLLIWLELRQCCKVGWFLFLKLVRWVINVLLRILIIRYFIWGGGILRNLIYCVLLLALFYLRFIVIIICICHCCRWTLLDNWK